MPGRSSNTAPGLPPAASPPGSPGAPHPTITATATTGTTPKKRLLVLMKLSPRRRRSAGPESSRCGLRLPPNQPSRSPRRSTAQTPGSETIARRFRPRSGQSTGAHADPGGDARPGHRRRLRPPTNLGRPHRFGGANSLARIVAGIGRRRCRSWPAWWMRRAAADESPVSRRSRCADARFVDRRRGRSAVSIPSGPRASTRQSPPDTVSPAGGRRTAASARRGSGRGRASPSAQRWWAPPCW